jgi:hypothetical protein
MQMHSRKSRQEFTAVKKTISPERRRGAQPGIAATKQHTSGAMNRAHVISMQGVARNRDKNSRNSQ